MTGYTVHTGATEKFTEGWDRVFGGEKPAASKKAAQAAKKKAAAKAAKKKAAKKGAKKKRKS